MRRSIFGILGFALGALVPFFAGCVRTQVEIDADLRRRAAFDLQCPENYLQITPLSYSQGSAIGGVGGCIRPDVANSQGVVGCGRRATYLLTQQCQWIMNSDSTPAMAMPVYPPPGYPPQGYPPPQGPPPPGYAPQGPPPGYPPQGPPPQGYPPPGPNQGPAPSASTSAPIKAK